MRKDVLLLKNGKIRGVLETGDAQGAFSRCAICFLNAPLPDELNSKLT